MGKEIYESLIQKVDSELLKEKMLRRKELLEKHKLYTEVYGPQSEEFNQVILENNKPRYYKKVYEDVTDQELERLESLVQISLGESTVETNSVRFRGAEVLGIIYGFFSLVIGVFSLASGAIGIGLLVIFFGVSIGVGLLTISHMIRQLNIIINNLNNRDKNI
ncbi:MAG: hypothetical protein CVV57_01450 [Tenericutes bacterium HGW-Tenericutes-2]|jgi:hypothetical protein|nr:MAG: hypothetical protein CVV57_01450 [Tenericutes bacterium HGW-Tenericutes-2]